jgi:endonuclease YncB( thermonuclease family)
MIAVLTLVLYLGLVPAAGAEALEAGGQATVLEVVDGDTLILEDRTEVRLAGIQAPRPG